MRSPVSWANGTPAPDAVTLPEPRAAAASAVTTDGLLLIGGRNADGPVATTWKSTLDSAGALGEWTDEQALQTPQADATAMVVGDFVWLFGGSDANGPVGAVQRGAFGQQAEEGLPENEDEGKVVRWDVSDTANLPVARSNGAGWGANGALYLAGGNDGSGPKSEVYWAVPTTLGDLPEWKHLPVMDLPESGLEGAAAVVSGPNAVLVGGTTALGPARIERSGQHRAAEPVLPARSGRGDGPGVDDRWRDRTTAWLPQRRGRRHRQLHHPDPDRLGVCPPRPDPRNLPQDHPPLRSADGAARSA